MDELTLTNRIKRVLRKYDRGDLMEIYMESLTEEQKSPLVNFYSDYQIASLILRARFINGNGIEIEKK
jgi:hypothetical protein